MADDLKDILANLNKDIDQEKLLQYLNRELSKEEQHEVEKHLNQDPFAADALEGLEMVADKKNIPGLVQQLNHELKKQTQRKKSRKEKRKLQQQPLLYIAVIIILMLIIVAYVVIRKMGN